MYLFVYPSHIHLFQLLSNCLVKMLLDFFFSLLFLPIKSISFSIQLFKWCLSSWVHFSSAMISGLNFTFVVVFSSRHLVKKKKEELQCSWSRRWPLVHALGFTHWQSITFSSLSSWNASQSLISTAFTFPGPVMRLSHAFLPSYLAMWKFPESVCL